MKKFLLAIVAFVCAVTGFVAVACEKNDKVALKFDTQCELTMADASVKKGDEFTLPTPQSRGEEWEFGGWYLNPECTGDAVTSVVADGNMTFYAKWEQLYKLTLNLDGGTLTGATSVYLKQGTVLSAYLAEYIPTKTNHQFGQWLNGSNALSSADRMPATALTLTAKYKVAYTVDVWTKSLAYLANPSDSNPEYEKESITLYEYATADFVIDYAPYGLYEVTAPAGYPARVGAGELKDDPKTGDNHFVLYFDRELYTINLNSNTGSGSREVSFNYYFDQVFELPYDLFTNVGYVFAGWSESSNGQNDYPIDYIDAVLYNKQSSDESEVKREKEYRAKSDATLYAYWNKGYSDLFGEQDTIFLLDENSTDIYLFRGGKFFKGEYNARNRSFQFFDKNDKIIFEGRLLDGSSFCYAEPSRAETHANAYIITGDGKKVTGVIDENKRIDLDDYNGITYTETIVETDVFGGTLTSRFRAQGTYTKQPYSLVPEWTEYTATFDSGDASLAGKTVKFLLRYTTDGTAVFTLRNDEEFELGTQHRLGVAEGGSLGIINSLAYSLTLTGYGSCVYYNGTDGYLCSYYYDNDLGTYCVRVGDSILYAKLISESGLSGYVPYFAEFDNEFASDSGSLVMDGMLHATYISGSTSVSGYYTLATSYIGNYIVTFTSGGTTYVFVLTKHEEGTGDNKVVFYTMEEKPAGYAEYRYYIGGTVLGQDITYRPILVLDDEEAGKASLYYSSGGKYIKSATGTYTLDKESGLYTLSDITVLEVVEDTLAIIDVSEISSMLFALDTRSLSSRVFYTYSITDLEDQTEVHYIEFKPERADQQDMKLLIVGGLAVFSDGNKNTYVGKYQTQSGLTIISSYDSENKAVTIILEITVNEERDGGTFIKYDTPPYYAYLYRENGTRYQYEYLFFDGKGGVTYTYRNEEGESVTVTGSFALIDEDNNIYLFTETDAEGDPITFRYILVTDGTYMYFSKISEKAGTYSSSMGTLTLDGIGLSSGSAQFSDTYGNTYMSQYRVQEEKENGLTLIYMYANGQYMYFEIDSVNHTFRQIGSELGTYLIMDNQYLDGRYVELDGEGNFTLYKMISDTEDEGEEDEELESSSSEVVAKAKYTVNSDGTITLSYTDSLSGVDTPVTITGRLGALQIGNYIYSVFVIQYNSVADTYVNEADYSVLILSDTGTATRYLSSGKVERGSYTLITDTTLGVDYSMLYYVNNEGTDATIYEYDTAKKLIWRVENSDRAFFSSELSSLRFTSYGFAIFDGTTRYYYHQNVNSSGTVTGYTLFLASREEIDGKQPNQYGFIEYSVELDGRKITYNDVTYYDNGGFSITFNREADTAEYYPVTVSDQKNAKTAKYNLTGLTFSPSGSTEFSVSGKVKLTRIGDDTDFEAEQTANATVVRRFLNDEGTEYEMFVLLATGLGYLRFDIDVVYDTEGKNNSSYNIGHMRYYLGLYNALDIYNLAQLGVLPGFGYITVERDYDTEGEPSEEGYRMTAEFGEIMGLIDANGDVLNFENMPCEPGANNSYSVTVDHTEADGYIYKGLISIVNVQGIYAFSMVFYREQEFEQDGYTFTVGRIVGSDTQSYVPGGLATLGVTDAEGNNITDVGLRMNDEWYIIGRTYSEATEETPAKLLSTTYFKLELTEREDLPDSFEKPSGLNIPLIKPYASITVTKIENVTTYYTEDGKSYVDIDEDNNVLLYCRNNQYYYGASESEYFDGEEGDPYYIMTMSSGTKYKITLKDKEDGEGKYVVVETYVDPEEE